MQEFDPRGRATLAAGDVREICRAWSLEHEFYKIRGRYIYKDDLETGITHINATFPL